MAISFSTPGTFTSKIQVSFTDRTSLLTNVSQTRSYAFRIFRRSSGGNALGRIFNQGNFDDIFPGAGVWQLQNIAKGDNFSLSGLGFGLNVWQNMVLVVDRTGTVTVATLWVNGVKGITNGTSTTSYSPSTSNFYIGNRSDGARGFDGDIAEFGIYNRLLNDDEGFALSTNYTPLDIRTSLVSYLPLINNTQDVATGAQGIVTNTAPGVQPHPKTVK